MVELSILQSRNLRTTTLTLQCLTYWTRRIPTTMSMNLSEFPQTDGPTCLRKVARLGSPCLRLIAPPSLVSRNPRPLLPGPIHDHLPENHDLVQSTFIRFRHTTTLLHFMRHSRLPLSNCLNLILVPTLQIPIRQPLFPLPLTSTNTKPSLRRPRTLHPHLISLPLSLARTFDVCCQSTS